VPTKNHEFERNGNTGQAAFALLEEDPDLIEIHEEVAGNVTGLTTWFRIAHYVVTAELYKLHLYENSDVCSVAEKYGFDSQAQKAKEWFDGWYHHRLRSLSLG
jgi:hypothetical protein